MEQKFGWIDEFLCPSTGEGMRILAYELGSQLKLGVKLRGVLKETSVDGRMHIDNRFSSDARILLIGFVLAARLYEEEARRGEKLTLDSPFSDSEFSF